MKYFLIFIFLNTIIYCQSKVYINSDLGIRFDYSEWDYTPYDINSDSARFNINSDWKFWQSKSLELSFSYPNGLEIKEGKYNGFYGNSINDTAIYIGYRNSIDSTIFYAVITIYKSVDEFNTIAENHYFEKDTSEHYSEWIIRSRGLPNDATYFEGKDCKGLRGQTYIRSYHCQGGYAGLGVAYRTLLVLKIKRDEKVALFYDSSGLSDCLEKEGVPDNDVWEDEFYKIASTIMIND